MFSFFERLWRRTHPQHSTLVSETQALSIANEAVVETPYHSMMGMATVEDHDGRRVWIVGSRTIGSGIIVVIDATTGEVVGRESWGVR